jgi:two-component sensor histidine kinase
MVMAVIRDVAHRRGAQQLLARQAEQLRSQRTAALELAREAQGARWAAEAAELRIADSLQEKEILLQEVHHRVKNNLQVISSLINMQARQVRGARSRAALQDCQTRLQAIALIHEKLYQSQDYARVPFVEYVRSLASTVFGAARVSRGAVALELALEDIALPVDKAIPCGLILNELISNALKHGFPKRRAGRVRIALATTKAEAAFTMTVCDDGVGFPEGFDPDGCRTLGVQLVRMLARQLGGEVSFGAEPGGGAAVRLAIPLTG